MAPGSRAVTRHVTSSGIEHSDPKLVVHGLITSTVGGSTVEKRVCQLAKDNILRAMYSTDESKFLSLCADEPEAFWTVHEKTVTRAVRIMLHGWRQSDARFGRVLVDCIELALSPKLMPRTWILVHEIWCVLHDVMDKLPAVDTPPLRARALETIKARIMDVHKVPTVPKHLNPTIADLPFAMLEELLGRVTSRDLWFDYAFAQHTRSWVECCVFEWIFKFNGHTHYAPMQIVPSACTCFMLLFCNKGSSRDVSQIVVDNVLMKGHIDPSQSKPCIEANRVLLSSRVVLYRNLYVQGLLHHEQTPATWLAVAETCIPKCYNDLNLLYGGFGQQRIANVFY